MKLNKTLLYGICTLVSAMTFSTVGFAEYKTAPAPLMTVWGEGMTPETAWPLHPRPNLERSNWQNLNGLWDYAVTPINAPEQPKAWEGKVLVPFAMESALSGVGRKIEPNEAIWYHRTFDVSNLDAERLLLHFDGVDFRSQVFVNGKEVTDYPHESGILPLTADVTDAVKEGTNDLLVYVWDPTDTWQNATGKQVLKPGGIMYTRTSGIWQPVWMETVPSTYVSGYEVDSDIERGIAYVKLKTVGNLKGAQATITVKDTNGKKVASGKVSDWEKPVELKMKAPQLWSPDNPYLYDMDIALKSSAGTDHVKGYFGMRKIEMRKDKNGIQKFFLNNEQIFMQGTLDQGWWPDGLLTPPSEEAMLFDIQFLKNAGFNMMRKHIKIEPMRYYYLCDKMGILLWQDMPSGPGDVNARYGMYRRELKQMVDHLQPIPSIVVWVPYNEGWGEQEAFKANASLSWLMEYDKTRLVDGPSGWTDHGVGHIKDMHNYPGPGMFDVMPNRISALGEFGGLGLAVPGHVWADNKGWGYVSDNTVEASFERYSSLMKRLSRLASQGLAGSVYTQTTDVEVEINGLLTYDRKVDKYGAENLKKLHTKVYEGATKSIVLKAAQPIAQEWKYTFDQPQAGWEKPDFNDSSWKSGKAGFGNDVIKKDNPQAQVNTVWDTKGIWIRREFNCDFDPNTADAAALKIFFDENPVLYLNGIEIARFSKWNAGYASEEIDVELLRKALRKGKNVLAVSAMNESGGAYIDLALEFMEEKK
jgi:hypothetical protein